MTSWAGVATARLRFRVPACGTGCAPAQARSRFASMKAGSSSTTASTPKADTRWAGCSSTQRTPRGSSPVLQNRSSRPNTITSSRASTATSASPAGTFPSTKPGVGSGCTTAGPTLAWPRPTLMSRRSSPRWRLAEAACRADATAARSRAARPGPGGLLRCGGRALRGSRGRSGVEGVACVDDAARASALLYNLWAATGNDELKQWAEGLLDFVLWMHAGGGLWHNFILDWNGVRNVDGPTSATGVNFWQARATFALAEANLLLRQDRAREVLIKALAVAESAAPPSDVRAIHALSLLAVLKRAPDPRLTMRLGAWCDEMAACQRGGMLMNSPDERDRPHLWGHVQEGVLADASVALDRPDLLTVAVNSAEAVFPEVIESGFDLPHVHSYEV